jgi:hypothetical protein
MVDTFSFKNAGVRVPQKKKTPAAMTSKGVVAVRHLKKEPRFDEFRFDEFQGCSLQLSPEFQINQVPLFA